MGNIVQKFHNMLDKTLYSRQATFEKFLNLKGSRLDEIGVHSMYYSNHYQPHQLMRNGKEPLHYNILLIIEGEIMIETPFKNQRVHAGEILCFPSTIPRDIYLVSERAKEIHVRIEEDSRKSLFNFKGLSVHKSDNIDAIFTLLNMCRETKNKKIKN